MFWGHMEADWKRELEGQLIASSWVSHVISISWMYKMRLKQKDVSLYSRKRSGLCLLLWRLWLACTRWWWMIYGLGVRTGCHPSALCGKAETCRVIDLWGEGVGRAASLTFLLILCFCIEYSIAAAVRLNDQSVNWELHFVIVVFFFFSYSICVKLCSDFHLVF